MGIIALAEFRQAGHAIELACIVVWLCAQSLGVNDLTVHFLLCGVVENFYTGIMVVAGFGLSTQLYTTL